MEDFFWEHVNKLDKNSQERLAMEYFCTKAWEGEDLSNYTQDEKYRDVKSDASKRVLFEKLIEMGKTKATVDNLLKINFESPLEFISVCESLSPEELANSKNFRKMSETLDSMLSEKFDVGLITSVKYSLVAICNSAQSKITAKVSQENSNNESNIKGKLDKLNKWSRY